MDNINTLGLIAEKIQINAEQKVARLLSSLTVSMDQTLDLVNSHIGLPNIIITNDKGVSKEISPFVLFAFDIPVSEEHPEHATDRERGTYTSDYMQSLYDALLPVFIKYEIERLLSYGSESTVSMADGGRIPAKKRKPYSLREEEE
jgi:hypothetical protein